MSHARFQVEHILSEPSDGWRGRKGRVDGALLQDLLIRPDGSRCFVCVCGPTAFTELTVRWVNATTLLDLISKPHDGMEKNFSPQVSRDSLKCRITGGVSAVLLASFVEKRNDGSNSSSQRQIFPVKGRLFLGSEGRVRAAEQRRGASTCSGLLTNHLTAAGFFVWCFRLLKQHGFRPEELHAFQG